MIWIPSLDEDKQESVENGLIRWRTYFDSREGTEQVYGPGEYGDVITPPWENKPEQVYETGQNVDVSDTPLREEVKV